MIIIKKQIIIFLVIFFTFFIFNVNAADCGGVVKCECGDTLVQSQTMWYDLECNGVHALNILDNHIILDCDDHYIGGAGISYIHGIKVIDALNVSVLNCEIKNYSIGIFVENSDNISILNSIASENRVGVLVENSKNGIFSNNEISKNLLRGLVLTDNCDNSIVNHNLIKENGEIGLWITEGSDHIIVEKNDFIENERESIFITGNPFLYNSYNNIIRDNNFIGNNQGIDMTAILQSKVENNVFKKNEEYAILLASSFNNTISNNVILDGHENGLYIDFSNDNNISNNVIGNNENGIRLTFSSSNNTIYGNKISNNEGYGIYHIYWPPGQNWIYGNYLIDNGVNAYQWENILGIYDIWDYNGIGNYWGDFRDNEGFPEYHILDEGVDHYAWGPGCIRQGKKVACKEAI